MLRSKVDLKEGVRELLRCLDIDRVGFANSNLYREVKGGSVPSVILPSVKVVVVYLYQLEKLERKYGKWYIVSLNNFISSTNEKLERFLREAGYEARGLQENEYDRGTLVGKISFRQLAALAGLGSVGRNQMLISERFGPRVVIGTTLTSAEVEPDDPYKGKLCTDCQVCVKSCPVGALSPTYDPWRCKNRRKILGKGCGLPCVNLCPIGGRSSVIK